MRKLNVQISMSKKPNGGVVVAAINLPDENDLSFLAGQLVYLANTKVFSTAKELLNDVCQINCWTYEEIINVPMFFCCDLIWDDFNGVSYGT